jgi:hypothetical protein
MSTNPFAVRANYNLGSGLPIFAIAVSQDGRYVFTTDNYGEANLANFHVIDLQAAGGPAEVSGSPFLPFVNTVRAYP